MMAVVDEPSKADSADDAVLEAAKQAAADVMDAADPTVHQEDDDPAAKADGDVQITVAQPEQSRSSLHRRHTRPMEPPVMTKLTSSMAEHHLRI